MCDIKIGLLCMLWEEEQKRAEYKCRKEWDEIEWNRSWKDKYWESTKQG
jgi:hypothetical protein